MEGTIVLETPDAGLDVELKTRLNLALIRFLGPCSFGAADSHSWARFAVRKVLNASIRSAGVASRIRRRLRVFWRYTERLVRERRFGGWVGVGFGGFEGSSVAFGDEVEVTVEVRLSGY